MIKRLLHFLSFIIFSLIIIVDGSFSFSFSFSLDKYGCKNEYSNHLVNPTSQAASHLEISSDTNIEKLSLKESNKNNNNSNSNNLQGIIISSLESLIPTVIVQIIKDYILNESLNELYVRVMKQLKRISNNQPIKIDFFQIDFPFKIYSIISTSTKISSGIILSSSFSKTTFWHDLMRLLFKWVLYMKQTMTVNITDGQKDDNNISTAIKTQKRELSRILKSFNSMIHQRIRHGFPLSLGSFNLQDQLSFSTLKMLLNCEFIENSEIFNLFSSALNDFYNGNDSDGIMKKSSHSLSPCEMLKIKYFSRDTERNNLLLKFLILMYDPIGEMKACFSKEEQLYFSSSPLSSLPLEPSFLIKRKIDKDYLSKLEKRGPENLLISDMKFTSGSIIEFFASSCRRGLQIWSRDELDVLKQKIDEIKYLGIGLSIDHVAEYKFREINTMR